MEINSKSLGNLSIVDAGFQDPAILDPGFRTRIKLKLKPKIKFNFRIKINLNFGINPKIKA